LFVGFGFCCGGFGAEAEGGPGERGFWSGAGGGNFFVIGVGGCEGGVAAGGVVVGAAGGVGEGVVGVVYLLEFLGAGGAFGGIGRDSVGVVFQGLSERMGQSDGGGVSEGKGGVLFIRISDLLLGCCGRDFEDCI
jgi:hypothetical protein